jgi:hypothetical protein
MAMTNPRLNIQQIDRHLSSCATPCGRHRGILLLFAGAFEPNIWTTKIGPTYEDLEKSALW